MNAPVADRRVLYVMTHYPKLAQTFIRGEIDGLRANGVEVSCVALNRPEPEELARPGARDRAASTIYLKGNAARSLLALAKATLRHPLAMARVWWMAIASGGGNPLRTMRRIAHLAHAARVERLMAKSDISHIHAHFGLAPATIAWLAAAIAGAHGRSVRYSFTIHGFHDFADPAESRLDCKVPDATAVICISDFTRSQLYLHADPGDWERCHVLRCGIDLTDFAYRDPPPISSPPVIVTVGRLSPEKGIETLIAALALLASRGREVPRLRLIGDGPSRSRLEAQAAAAGLAGRIDFAGERTPEQVRAELEGADIFCMASFSEGLPISLMEAMAVGVPCITTWIAGIPELAVDNLTALTVPPTRPDELADAIERLVGDSELRTRLARAARERVEQLHDARRSAEEMNRMLFESETR